MDAAQRVASASNVFNTNNLNLLEEVLRDKLQSEEYNFSN